MQSLYYAVWYMFFVTLERNPCLMVQLAWKHGVVLLSESSLPHKGLIVINFSKEIVAMLE
jgi:hypothetical protein